VKYPSLSAGGRRISTALWLVLLPVSLASGEQPQRVTFWLEARGIGAEETRALLSHLARATERSLTVAPAARREEADFLIRLQIEGRRAEFEEGGPGVLTPDEQESVLAETSEASASSLKLHLELWSLLDGISLHDRRLLSPVPLVVGDMVVSTPLRATLSSFIAPMESWAKRSLDETGRSGQFAVPDAERASLDPLSLGRRLMQEAGRAARAGFGEAALALAGEAQPLFKQSGARSEEGSSWEQLAYLMLTQGRERERAESYARQTIKIARETANARAEGRSLLTLAAIEARGRRYPEAARLAEMAERLGREQDDVLVEGFATAALGGLAAARGDFRKGQTLQLSALERVRPLANRRAEARILLSLAVVESYLDERDLKSVFSRLPAVRAASHELQDRGLARDQAFVAAAVRYATTNLRFLRDGELEALRALKLSQRLKDGAGEAAAWTLLGAYAHRLGRPAAGFECLERARQLAAAAGFPEALAASFQLQGELDPLARRGAAILRNLLELPPDSTDLRLRVKTLSDLCRLYSGLGELDEGLRMHGEARAAVEAYRERLQAGLDHEDLGASFITVIKSLITTRTELPPLPQFLRLSRLVPPIDPSWLEDHR
jgi:tetratricopeptide (TPR) repeat protein